MKFKKALLKEEINQQLVDIIKEVRKKISAHPKISKYIESFDPISAPFAYVLGKGKKYSVHCIIKWAKVTKKAEEEKTKDSIIEQEMTVADRIVRGIKDYIIGLDYLEYDPKVIRKADDKVIQIVFTTPSLEKVDNTVEEPIVPQDDTTTMTQQSTV